MGKLAARWQILKWFPDDMIPIAILSSSWWGPLVILVANSTCLTDEIT